MLFADSVAAALRHVYDERRLRVARLGLEIQEEDYRAFFDLKHRINRQGVSDDAIARLDALRKKAPAFLEVGSFEAKPLSVSTRTPASPATSTAAWRSRKRPSRRLQRPEHPGPSRRSFPPQSCRRGVSTTPRPFSLSLAEINPAGSLFQKGQLAERRGRPAEASGAGRRPPSASSLPGSPCSN